MAPPKQDKPPDQVVGDPLANPIEREQAARAVAAGTLLIAGSLLRIGDRFRLTGDACNEAERNDTRTFKVVNKCLDDHKGGAHLMVEDETGKVEETMLAPWVKVQKIEPR